MSYSDANAVLKVNIIRKTCAWMEPGNKILLLILVHIPVSWVLKFELHNHDMNTETFEEVHSSNNNKVKEFKIIRGIVVVVKEK